MIVSLADKLHNARAIVSDLMITGPRTWDRFNASPEDILWYYNEILRVGRQCHGGKFLLANLAEAIRTIGELRQGTTIAENQGFSS